MNIEIKKSVAQINGCSCDQCKAACQHAPGFYAFGQIEKAAQAKGMTPKEFFKAFCVVNWWDNCGDNDKDIYLISPATLCSHKGGMANYDPRGRCIHFTDSGLCDIHDSKPIECQQYFHGLTKGESKNNHEAAARSWDNPEAQAMVKELAGFEPFTPEDDGSLSLWNMFF